VADDFRKSGIGAVGDIPWGTHFCYFYESQSDLLDVLIPYFKTGLEQNEFCVWGVFDPLGEQEARDALERALPGAEARLAAGDIEFVPQSQGYREDGAHDLRQLVRDWEAKLENALARGFAGMRVNVNPVWLAERARQNIDVCEDELSGLIANRHIIMLCGYPLAPARVAEISDAGYTHRLAMAKRNGNWQIVETPELRQARATVKRLHAELQQQVSERTGQLAAADIDRKRETVSLYRLEEALRQSGERSRCYFKLELVGMAIVSPAKGFIEVNHRLCDILGYERHELMQITWEALTHPDDLADAIERYHRILAGDLDGYLATKRWIRKNGNAVHTILSVNCQRRDDGSVDYLAAMVEEMTGTGPSATGDPAAASEAKPDLEGHQGLPGHKDLSRREREVVQLIGFGRKVKEIAVLLALSEKTVSTYRSRILTKLHLKSTAELIRYALKNGLVE
jgi:PAS domain S-box-containing protein